MANVTRVYKGTCTNCDWRAHWLVVGDDDDLKAVPPAVIVAGHLCQTPAADVELVYVGEAPNNT